MLRGNYLLLPKRENQNYIINVLEKRKEEMSETNLLCFADNLGFDLCCKVKKKKRKTVPH